jgi:hypothetical protein
VLGVENGDRPAGTPLNTQVACPCLIGATAPRISRPGSRKPSAEE